MRMKAEKFDKAFDKGEDVESLSPAWRRELKRRTDDLDDPVRYVVFSDIGGRGRWRFWLDVSSDCYGMSIDQATLFKREHIARAVAKAQSAGRKNDLLVAKITEKDGKRRVVKYDKPNPRTKAPTIRR